MSYDYQKQRPRLFTDDGVTFIRTAEANARKLCGAAGVATMGRLIGGMCGDAWDHLAAVDYLVEIGVLVEVPRGDCFPMGQHRIFRLAGESA